LLLSALVAVGAQPPACGSLLNCQSCTSSTGCVWASSGTCQASCQATQSCVTLMALCPAGTVSGSMYATALLPPAGSNVPVYSSTPMYASAPVVSSVPMYTAPASPMPVYTAPIAPVYAAPVAPVYAAPVASSAPVYTASSVPMYAAASVPVYSSASVPMYASASVRPVYASSSVPVYASSSMPMYSPAGSVPVYRAPVNMPYTPAGVFRPVAPLSPYVAGSPFGAAYGAPFGAAYGAPFYASPFVNSAFAQSVPTVSAASFAAPTVTNVGGDCAKGRFVLGDDVYDRYCTGLNAQVQVGNV